MNRLFGPMTLILLAVSVSLAVAQDSPLQFGHEWPVVQPSPTDNFDDSPRQPLSILQMANASAIEVTAALVGESASDGDVEYEFSCSDRSGHGCGCTGCGSCRCCGQQCRCRHAPDCCRRQNLFGDCGGFGPRIVECGITPDLQITQFYQGVVDGGARENSAYGGKLDYFLLMDGEKLFGCCGLTAVLHAETRFGEDIIFDAVTLAPSNVNMLYPSLENETAITGLQFQQVLTKEWALTFGKFNALDLFYTLYPQTGRGINGFMNASLVLPLNVARTVPLSFMSAGLMKMKGKQIQGALLVYDSKNVATTSGLSDLFENGANILGGWRFFTKSCGLPGSHFFLGTWADGEFTTLDPLGWAFVPGQGFVADRASGSWSATYILEQKLWVDRCNPQRSLGLLSMWGWADSKTSPYEWNGNVGIQAQGPFRSRPADTAGFGYFYNGLSSDLKDLLGPLGLRDPHGVEMYYNAAITPWLHLTSDLQLVEPAVRSRDTAVVLGLRANMQL